MKQERSTLPRHKSHSRYHHRASEYKKKLNTLLLTPCRSSLTVEAALALTLVILASVVLMVPMLILNHQRNAALEMHENARQMAKQKYVEYYRAKDGSLTLDQDLLNSGETVLTALGLGHQISQPGMQNIDLLSDSEITKETVRYIANYDAVLPFSVLGLDHLSQQVVVSRRAWIGAKGNRWMENNGGETEDDPVVYVSTRDTDVYHTTRACSYLTHDILEARGEDMRTLRNKFGGKYSPCATCRPNLSMSTVYYTLAARSYHTTPSCRTISSNVQEIKKSEAESYGKHGCVRCG